MEYGPYDSFHLNINTTSFLRDLKQYVPSSLQSHGEATIGNCRTTASKVNFKEPEKSITMPQKLFVTYI